VLKRMRTIFQNQLVMLVCLACLSLTVLGGCGTPKVPVSDKDASKTLAEKLLTQWQSGITVEQLSKETPPVYVTEDLWLKGATLTEYKFVGDGEMLGPSARFKIALKCKGKDGKVVDRSFFYLVTTTPAMTFSREEG
jgi:hypothetical protein